MPYPLIPGVNDLITLFPEIAKQWSYEDNTDIDINLLSSKSNYKVWWICTLGHKWESKISQRTRNPESGCIYCSNRKILPGYNDLATKNPEVIKEWNFEKNKLLDPSKLSPRSHTKVWWICKNQHEWEAPIQARFRKDKIVSCAICVNQKVLPGFNDFATFHPLLAAEWHPTKNILKASEVTPGTVKKYWWICEKGHEWDMTPNARTNSKQGCPYCVNKRILVGFNDLATTHPELVCQWHPTKNFLSPFEVTFGSTKSVWWICEKGHEWEAKINGRTGNGYGCLVCSNRKVLKGFNDLVTLKPELAAEWHPIKNGDLRPDEVTPGARKRIWWLCSKGHEWETQLNDRNWYGTQCPQCSYVMYASKGEDEIAEYIEKYPQLEVLRHNRPLGFELDIWIPERQFAIEFNGIYWHNETRKAVSYHYDKWKTCKDKGIQLIQVWEDDWNRNPELVKRMLAHKLGFSQEHRVQARKLVVREVTTDVANEFLNENHIQGAVDGGIRVGLFENIEPLDTEQKPLAVMVLKREAGTEGKTLNLLRYATSANVVGGFTKLLKHVEREFEPESIVTFSDNTVSDGGLYKNNGFVNVKELKPDYMYVVKNNREHKFGYRLKRFREDPALQFEEGLSESELATLNNIPRIWDAGKIKWEKKYSE